MLGLRGAAVCMPGGGREEGRAMLHEERSCSASGFRRLWGAVARSRRAMGKACCMRRLSRRAPRIATFTPLYDPGPARINDSNLLGGSRHLGRI